MSCIFLPLPTSFPDLDERRILQDFRIPVTCFSSWHELQSKGLICPSFSFILLTEGLHMSMLSVDPAHTFKLGLLNSGHPKHRC
jgi:hypothetical protein